MFTMLFRFTAFYFYLKWLMNLFKRNYQFDKEKRKISKSWKRSDRIKPQKSIIN